ncbi:ribosomal subunit interface protein [Candidatus Nomurabacteria bacterium RIFCSPLOWO2_01_FULL_40_15]|uniref:Ribosomal subunit interface protein n=1 Tax=Candidatus Nomurabacteria bacterium RIFCSPLOWO2_01_FULL_40_15 TaxID=1801772 RepID=A0A1F6X8E4_9BACT|nr:MAG: ribosomal subunit interface protein [Candidatus Nomurabacteria bacterium RIFCSPLOWO2_01_FULL_40_15]
MKINIKATGIELTPAISHYATKKVSSLEKYVRQKDAVAQIEIGRSTQHHKKGDVFRAEIRITGAGLNLYATSEQSDLYAAIDLVKDNLKETLLQYKGKRETLTRRGAKAIKNMIKGFNIFKKRG